VVFLASRSILSGRTTIRALFATNGGRAKGFLAESGGVRARESECAREREARELEAREERARACSGECGPPETSRSSTRFLHVSLTWPWLFRETKILARGVSLQKI
jgi:hypothetical protein